MSAGFVRRMLRGRALFALFLILGVAFSCAYVGVTHYDQRGHDYGSHLGHVRVVQQGHWIAAPEDCWECAQPPAYYALAAMTLKAVGVTIPPNKAAPPPESRVARSFQALGVVLGGLTLAAWLAMLWEVLPGPYARAWAAALCAFWPTFVVETCKVGNDALLYTLAAAAAWQLVRWQRTGQARPLVVAGAFAGLAPFAKANGWTMVLVVLAAIASAIVLPRPGKRRWPEGAGRCLALLGTLAAGWFFVFFHWKHGVFHIRFDAIGGHLVVKNRWQDFLWVDPRTFLEDPWVHFREAPARDEYWNYLLRSSVLGESASPRPGNLRLAYALVLLALALLPLALVGLGRAVRRAVRPGDDRWRPPVLLVLGFLGFGIAFRLSAPFSVHNDFRFVLPIVPALAAMAAWSADGARRWLARRSWVLAFAPALLVVSFCACAVVFDLRWQ